MNDEKLPRIYKCEKKLAQNGQEFEVKEVTVVGENLENVRKHFDEIWRAK